MEGLQWKRTIRQERKQKNSIQHILDVYTVSLQKSFSLSLYIYIVCWLIMIILFPLLLNFVLQNWISFKWFWCFLFLQFHQKPTFLKEYFWSVSNCKTICPLTRALHKSYIMQWNHKLNNKMLKIWFYLNNEKPKNNICKLCCNLNKFKIFLPLLAR